MSIQPSPTGESAERIDHLVREARDGSRAAFAALVDEFSARIRTYLIRWTGNLHDAEDLTQDTFLKAFRSLPRFHSPKAFQGWLFTIARHTALNHLRARHPSEPIDPDSLVAPNDPSRAAEARDDDLALWALARRELTPSAFEALWLRYAEELSVREVGRVTGRTALHIRVVLHRARKTLLKALETNPRGMKSAPDSSPSTNPSKTSSMARGFSDPAKLAASAVTVRVSNLSPTAFSP